MSKNTITVEDHLTTRRRATIDTIIELRESCGASQQDVANLLGCSRSRVARIETGENGEYLLGELELLALRFGQDPALFLNSLIGDRARLEHAYANAVTHPALGKIITCSLPPGVEAAAPTPTDMTWFMIELAWSPDGMFLAGAIPGDDNPECRLLCVWNGATGSIEQAIHTDGHISVMAFSPDGTLLAVATDMDAIEVWDWRRNVSVACLDPVDSSSYSEELWELVNSTGYGVISQLQFSPDGQILAALNEGHGTLRLWSTEKWVEFHTLPLPEMFDNLDIKRAGYRLGTDWQITWADEDEDRPRFGEFPVEQLAFTPGSNMLAILPIFGRELELFTLTGKHIRGEQFPERHAKCIDIIGLNETGDMMLVAVGGEKQLFEAWYQKEIIEREFIHTTMDDPPVGTTIHQVKILHAGCVLGVVQNKEDQLRKVLNLVSNQPVPLPDAGPWSHNIQLAPTGQAVAYQGPGGQIKIRQLQPEHLTQSASMLRIRLTRRPQATPAHLTSFFEREETKEEFEAEFYSTAAQARDTRAAASARPDQAAGQVEGWLERIKLSERQGEAYGLAVLPPEDKTTIQTLLDIIQTGHDRVLLVELPQPGPRIKKRPLVAYIAQRTLRRGETTQGVIAELENEPYDVIIIDRAEKLHHEAMLGICDSLQNIAGLFVLVARNEESFMKEAGKIRAGLEWLLSRAVWNSELRNLGKQEEEPEQEKDAHPALALLTSPDPDDKLEWRLHHLKTAIPRAQGGYGLAILPHGDLTTVLAFIDKVRQQTREQITLAQLPVRGPKIKLRQLVESIVGRSLKRGERTNDVIHTEIMRQYNIVVIDNAEMLHQSTLLWICSNMRNIVDAFLLTVHDQEAFMKMVDKTNQPSWALGRSIPINLDEIV